MTLSHLAKDKEGVSFRLYELSHLCPGLNKFQEVRGEISGGRTDILSRVDGLLICTLL